MATAARGVRKNTVKAKQGLLLDEDQNIDEIKGFTVNQATLGKMGVFRFTGSVLWCY